MENKLLLGLRFLDKKFSSPFDIEELKPHIELVLKLAEEKETFSAEEKVLLKKLLYKLERFEKFIDLQQKLFKSKFKFEGRL